MPPTADRAIRPLGPQDATTFQTLRLRGLRDTPEAFGSTYDEDVALALDVIAQRLMHSRTSPARVVFGAWRDTSLVGVVGAMQSPKRKTRHSVTVWGMYVAPEARRQGIGRELMEALLAEVREWPDVARVTLSVVDRAIAAHQLYSALGFIEFGREGDAYREAGIRDTAVHMALAFDDLTAA